MGNKAQRVIRSLLFLELFPKLMIYSNNIHSSENEEQYMIKARMFTISLLTL